ncbi:hypothetical protein B0H16DRAFT_1696021 [Mycena metata]|uniref:Uncharacterized protein n=1 Tax=Mycena metata TaxID=1033252 RepID=A0AAD7I4D5_9AGAR|nr:hypothetical protein B0H16DRAFT_1696021 [Mycena metata]
MTFPQLFDAFVPSNGPAFLAASNITPAYAASFAYAKKLTPPGVFGHVIRCFYFALALLYTGFPSGTPGVAQIGFEELALRLYHTTLLHDLGLSNATMALTHPAHAMTFELHGAFMAYEHLHAAAPNLDPFQVGDIVESIVLHTSQWSSGNSSANQILMALSALFDVGGFNGTGIVGLDFKQLFDPRTVAEIEQAYPRGDFYEAGITAFDREFTEKPNCLLGHYPGGLDALSKDLRVGPIVPGDSRRRNVVAPKRDPHLHYLDQYSCSFGLIGGDTAQTSGDPSLPEGTFDTRLPQPHNIKMRKIPAQHDEEWPPKQDIALRSGRTREVVQENYIGLQGCQVVRDCVDFGGGCQVVQPDNLTCQKSDGANRGHCDRKKALVN